DYVDINLEPFDEEGTSLSAKSTVVELNDDVTISASTYEKVSGFKVQADNSGTGHTIASVEFWNDCR
ncbi:MAG: hypothetical protein JRH20_26640, partial [Deltaproteobacteria bacterium]|nr:hypothetical protein [Deltaproteobacteria bacterium]